MADNLLKWEPSNGNTTAEDNGDCAADPIPALLDEDDMNIESGFIERFWLPLSVAVVAGWVAMSLILVNAFGWTVLLAIGGVVLAGAGAAVALVKTGAADPVELGSSENGESEDVEFGKAA